MMYWQDDFHQGKHGESIASDRYYNLLYLAYEYKDLKIAFRDSDSTKFTTWKSFWEYKHNDLLNAVDVHREILPNEIIVESDYPEYERNWEAARVIGNILETKGFSPLYYFSGNKSIHIHCFIDENVFRQLPSDLVEELEFKFVTKNKFLKTFYEHLRKKIQNCWDLSYKDFDKQIKATAHLIRAEGSKNKLTYKTFIGYSYKDIPLFPIITSKETGVYPKVGKKVLSHPNNILELIEEMLAVKKVKRKIQCTLNASGISKNAEFILSDEFIKKGDCAKRGLFILINELKKCKNNDDIFNLVSVWNSKLPTPFRDEELKYRINRDQIYNLSQEYIDTALEEIQKV